LVAALHESATGLRGRLELAQDRREVGLPDVEDRAPCAHSPRRRAHALAALPRRAFLPAALLQLEDAHRAARSRDLLPAARGVDPSLERHTGATDDSRTPFSEGAAGSTFATAARASWSSSFV